MPTEIDRLLDERAVRRQLLTYCTAIDTCDADLLRSVYHPDSTDDHGSFKGNGHDFVDAVVPVVRDHWDATQHTIGDTLFDWVDDDTVRTETYVLAQHFRRRDEDRDELASFAGVYLDRFERRDGMWRIADRVCVHTWDKRERVDAWYPDGTFTERRDGAGR